MENATKALLIAASVLIVIVLIAIGIRILSATNGVTNSVDDVSEAMGISVFNSQFTKYAGEQSAPEVKSLLSYAAATYRGNSKHKVKVWFNSRLGEDANTISGFMSNVNNTLTYNVGINEPDANGYIYEITITAKP